jgi:hypothetical protein
MSSSSNLRVRAKCDQPVKEATLTLASSSTYAEVVAAVAKAFDLKEDVAKRYSLYSVAQGFDVLPLGKNKDKAEKETLAEAGVRTNSSLFVRAPTDIKPQKKRPKKKKKAVEGAAPEEKTAGSDKERYKGLTPKNILAKLAEAKEASARKKKIMLEFVDIHITSIIKDDSFLKLSKEQLGDFLKSERLNIKEADLFDGVILWAKEQAKSVKSDKKEKEVLLEVMADLMPLIRFPAMSTQDIATRVSPLGLLSNQQILDLFTYLGMRTGGDKKAKLGKSIAHFTPKERKGRKPPAWFTWDQSRKHSSLIVTSDGLTVSSTTTSYYQPIVGTTEMKEGTFEWEVTLSQFYVNSYSLNIGVAPSSYSNWSSSQMIGYSGHVPGWCFGAGYGQKWDNGSQSSYGKTCSQGDRIRVKVDMDAKTLEFFINDSSQGVAFTNLSGSLRPAMSLYGSNTVTTAFPK